jgi:hypothetical protein
VRWARLSWYDHFVTTTEPPLPVDPSEPPCVGAVGYTPNPVDPMRLWLEANGLTMEQIPLWPEIEIKDGRMRIERMQRWDDHEQHYLLGQPFTWMSGWIDLKRPMPDELWETYERNRDRALIDRTLTRLGKTGATVVRLEGGDGLMFITSDRTADKGVFDDAQTHLRGALPGVEITLVMGFDTVMHRAGPQS